MSLDDALYVLSITAVLALLDGTFAVFGAALSLRFLRGLDVVFALPALGLLGLGWLVWGPHELLAVLPLKRVEITAEARDGQWHFVHMHTGAQETDALTVPHDIPVHLTVRSETERRQLYIPTLRVRVEVDPGETESVWFRAAAPTREDAAYVVYDRYRPRYPEYEREPFTVRVVSLDDFWAYQEPCSLPFPWDQCGERFGDNELACWGERLSQEMGCMGCHAVDGPSVGPPLRGMWGSTTTLTDGRTPVVDDQYFTRALLRPQADIAAGFDGADMPAYHPTPDRILALRAYLMWLTDPNAPVLKERNLRDPG
ncbi:MAG: c-type cytochrome [Sandaracinaceae bacterium]|nr:c-type cytochrome [Sandaracinaceae bacterium]